MQKFASPDPDLMRESFSCDEDTGNLIWKDRPRRHFPTDHGWKTFNSKHAGKVAGHSHTCTVGKTYIQVRVGGRLHYAHRIVWVLHNGPIPDGMQVDHEDGNGTNNRIGNLRLVTVSINKRNQRRLSTNTTGVTGVYFDKRRNKFYARAWINDRPVNLGEAATLEGAAELRERFNRENGFHPNHGKDRPL